MKIRLRQYEYIRQISIFISGITVIILAVFVQAVCSDDDIDTIVASEIRCGVEGQNFIDGGSYQEAINLLPHCITRYSESDFLISLYGEAIYLSGDLREGERQFRAALALNKNNPIAKKYITEIRNTRDLLQDQDLAAWLNLAKDKGADLLLLILGVWIGTLLTLLSQKVVLWLKKSDFKKAILSEDYDKATDILEEMAANARKQELRVHLKHMITCLGIDESRQVIREYVDDNVLEKKIIYFLDKIIAKELKQQQNQDN